MLQSIGRSNAIDVTPEAQCGAAAGGIEILQPVSKCTFYFDAACLYSWSVFRLNSKSR